MLKFLYKLVNLTRSYKRKQKGMVFVWTQCICNDNRYVACDSLRPDGLQRHQDGNIRRFTSNDDDDDSATWNGNSTQQMWPASLHRNFWPDCKPEGPLFSAEFVCLSVCLSVCVCVSDRHFYPSTLTDFDETWSQGPYSDLVWPRP